MIIIKADKMTNVVFSSATRATGYCIRGPIALDFWNKIWLCYWLGWLTRFVDVGWFLKTKQEFRKWPNDVVFEFWSWEGKCYCLLFPSWVVLSLLFGGQWLLLTFLPKREGFIGFFFIFFCLWEGFFFKN